MKSNHDFDEKWLQRQLIADPSLLGIGDELEVRDVERPQPRAGRLDLLLVDPETLTRYEVEIQLGATDPEHIIRTIEYWDIERARYPQYEHVAVLVAEDVTNRFLNVISLFNKAIPLIAIEMSALKVGQCVTLKATRILDQTALGTEEDDQPRQLTDRQYWLKKATPKTVAWADELLVLINEATGEKYELNFNKYYIGLTLDGVAQNFVTFRPRKDHIRIEPRIARSDDLNAIIDDSEVETMSYDLRWGRYRIKLTELDLKKNKNLLVELIKRAADTSSSE